MNYFRIDVQPPGSPGWLKFKTYDTEEAANEAAAALAKDTILYQRVRVWHVEETLTYDTGAG